VSGISAHGVTTVNQTVSTTTLNGPSPIYVVIDPAGALNEVRRDNNTAFRFYQAGSGNSTDLSISSADAVFSPSTIVSGQPVTLTLTVHNLSAFDALHVPVRIQRSSTEILAQLDLPVVAALGSASGATTLTFTSNDSLVVTVDPDHLLNDPTRTNNSINVSVNLSASNYETNLSSLSVGGNAPNQNISVTANSSGQLALNTVVVFTKGDPSEPGSVELGRAPVSFGPNAPTVQQHVPIQVGGLSLPNDALIFACINPTNQPAEGNSNDNCLSTVTNPTHQSNLSVHANEFRFNPVGPDVGEAVTLTAPIHNISSNQATAVARIWADYPAQSDAQLLAEKPVTVPGNGLVAVSIPFIRPAGGGDVTLSLEDVVPADSDTSDNQGPTNVFVAASIDTGRRYSNAIDITPPVVGDLLGTGHPQLVFGEQVSVGNVQTARVTSVMVNADGSFSEQWSQLISSNGANPLPLTLADLDGDGRPEVISHVVGARQSNSEQHILTAFEPDGTIKWQTSVTGPNNGCDNIQQQSSPAVGDLNGDGVADVVFADPQNLFAFSGKDGSVLFGPIHFSSNGGCNGLPQVVIADVDDDGFNEITVNSASFFQFDHSGNLRWQGGFGQDFALVDLDLDGFPEIVTSTQEGPLLVYDGRTGHQVLQNNAFPAWPLSMTSGALRQDGLTYPVLANDSVTGALGAFNPSGQLLWFNTVYGSNEFGGNFQSTPVDLLGEGRPQIAARGGTDAFNLFEGRDGHTLIKAKLVAQTAAQAELGPPVIADLFGTGGAQWVVNNGGGLFGGPTTSKIGLPASDFVVLSSVHWHQMPKVWNQSNYVRSQVDEHLQLASHFQPWKTHNTWGEQFLDQPAQLLPDLTVASNDLSTSPATPTEGDPATVSVVVHNLGGLAASDLTVDLYDGDPDGGAPHIGSAVAAGPIAVRTGTATVAIPWTPYPDGEHQLFAVVNAGQSPQESGYENNKTSARFFVQTGTDLSDVSVNSLSISPSTPITNSLTSVTATVSNLGVKASGDFLVGLYDGVPQPGDANRIGTAPVSSLAPGASAQVSLAWIAVPGGHELFLVADPEGVTQDANRGNNTAELDVTSPAESSPDLVLLAREFTATPAQPTQGDVVTLSATVLNLGTDVPGTSVRFYEGDPTQGGVALGTVALPGNLPAGGTATATFSYPTLGKSGTVVLFAVVDPDNQIAESDESNNEAQLSLTITDPQLGLLVATDQASYPANATVGITTTLHNLSSISRSPTLDLWVEDGFGNRLTTLDSAVTEVLSAGQIGTVSASWNTATQPPGTYRAHAQLSEGEHVRKDATATFSIQAQPNLFARLTLDQVLYLPGDHARIQQFVQNQSANTPSGPLTTQVTLSDGSQVLFQQVRSLNGLSVSQSFSASDLFDISPMLAPGSYPVTLEASDANGVVASAFSTLVVSASTPQQSLVARITASPTQFGPGQSTHLSVSLSNQGNVAVDTPVTVEVRDADALDLEATFSGQAQVAVGGTQTLSFTWTPTAGLNPGLKLAMVEVNGSLLDRTLVTLLSQPVDTTPPQIVITGVMDQQLTNQVLTPTISITDQSAFTSNITLDGLPFISGTAVSNEGDHLLVVDAVDIFGNASHVEVRFTQDFTPPVLTIAGVTSGEITNQPVTISFAETDLHPGTVTATLKGAPFTSGTTVSAEGDYVLVVTGTDGAGNSAQQAVTFSIDLTPPVISILGVSQGEITQSNLSPTFTESDAHPGPITATLNGQAFASGTQITNEGDYTLVVTATDQAGNSSSQTISFSIDRTPPILSINGVFDGEVSATALTPIFSAADAHGAVASATLDGQPFASATLVSSEGDHVLVVTATDPAGNSAQQAVHFAIDRTGPVITISGFAEGQVTSASVTVSFSAGDAHPASVNATLNGTPFSSGTVVSAEGDYTVLVTAIDQAGNSASKTAHFSIDRTAPVITVSGVTDGQLSGTPLTINYSATDLHLASVQATLDGASFASGSTVSVEGDHSLIVTATDAANNIASRTIHFSIDLSAPIISITGVTEGQFSRTPVVIGFSSSDAHPGTTSATLDGVPFVTGSTVSAEGDHVLVVTATDAVGHASTRTLHFTLDFTPPVITITGVQNGQTYSSPPTPVITVTDLHLDSTQTSITLDGQPFTSGTPVATNRNGSHTLAVSARDLAGNSSSQSVSFTVQANTVTITGSGQENPQKRALVGFSCRFHGCFGRSCPPSTPELNAALAQANLQADVADNPADFQNLLRENRYQVLVLYQPDDLGFGGELGKEITEHIHEGVGLLVIRNSPAQCTDLEDVLGVKTLGTLQHVSNVSVTSALGSAGSLSASGDLVFLQLNSAQAGATALQNHSTRTVASVNSYGAGQAILLGWDTETVGSQRMIDVIASALGLASSGPTPERVSLSVAEALTSVTNQLTQSQGIRLTATLPSGATFLFGTPTPLSTSPPTWLATLTALQSSTFDLGIRLPDSSGTDLVSLELDQKVGGNFTPLSTFSVPFSVPETGAQLLSDAESQLQNLVVNGLDVHERNEALSALQQIHNPPVRLSDAETQIEHVLDAIGETREIQHASTDQVRTTLDALLRFQENQYSNLRGWP
jgi:subtilase family serine protease